MILLLYFFQENDLIIKDLGHCLTGLYPKPVVNGQTVTCHAQAYVVKQVKISREEIDGDNLDSNRTDFLENKIYKQYIKDYPS